MILVHLGLALLLKSLDNVLVLPADLLCQAAEVGGLAARGEADNLERIGDDELLLDVVHRGNTLKDLEALEGSFTALGLAGDHATDSLVEHARGGAEVVRAASGVGVHALVKVAEVLDCSRVGKERD